MLGAARLRNANRHTVNAPRARPRIIHLTSRELVTDVAKSTNPSP